MKLLLSLLLSINISITPAVGELSITENDNSSQIITTKMIQTVNADGSDIDTSFDNYNEQEVYFENEIKNIYCDYSSTTIKDKNIFKEIKQLGEINQKDQSGSYNGGDWDYDLNHRVCDWIIPYGQRILLEINQSYAWQQNNGWLAIEQKEIWKANSDYTNIIGDVEFNKNGENGVVINGGEEINWNYGFDRNFYSCNDSIIGIDYSIIKECYHFDLFWNFVDRFIYNLKTPNNEIGTSRLNDINNQVIDLSTFDLDNLLEINVINLTNFATIEISINEELTNAWDTIDQSQKLYDSLLKYQFQNETIKELILNGIESFDITIDNYNYFIDLVTVEEFNTALAKYSSSFSEIAQKYHLSLSCNGKEIFNDVLNKCNFIIDYNAVIDPIINVPTNNILEVSGQDLKNGVQITIYPNQEHYQFSINSISNKKYVDSQYYINESSTNQLAIGPNIHKISDCTYALDEIKYESIEFKDDLNRNYYPQQLDDEEIIDNSVVINDNYGNKISGSNLKKEQFSIVKNDLTGTIIVYIELNDKKYEQQYLGFKQAEALPKEIEIDGEQYHRLIASDIDCENIKDILVFNGIDEYIVSSLTFYKNINDLENGIVNFIVIDCLNNSTKQYYQNQQISLVELNQFYFYQKEISNNEKQFLPSEIDKNYFMNNFVEYSNEFFLRCYEETNVNLISNDETGILKAEIIINNWPCENGTKSEVFKFEYQLSKNDQMNFDLTSIIISSIMGVLIIVVIGYLIYLKFK